MSDIRNASVPVGLERMPATYSAPWCPICPGLASVAFATLLALQGPGCASNTSAPDSDGTSSRPATPVPDQGSPTPDGENSPTPEVSSPTPATPSPDTPTPVDGITLAATQNPAAPLSWTFDVGVWPAGIASLVCDELLEEGEGERHVARGDGGTLQTITLYGFKPETRYRCTAQHQDLPDMVSEPVEFTTDPLPSEIASFHIAVAAPDSSLGYTLVGEGAQLSWSSSDYLYDYDYTVIVDPYGNVRWYSNTYSSGDIDISYLGSTGFGVPAMLWGGEGGVYVAPTVRTLDFQNLFVGTDEEVASWENRGAFNHDVGLSQRGTSIFALVHSDLPPDGSSDAFDGFVVKEIDLETNTNIWSWDAWTDGIERGQLETCTTSSSYYPDCYHANAVFDSWEIDPVSGEERLYIYLSLRNQSRVMKIDYVSKDVVWSLGNRYDDFVLLEPDGSPADKSRWFYGQHDARRDGDRITVYDNGYGRQNNGGVWYSRGLELELDEVAGTATLAFEYEEYDEQTQETTWKERVWGGYQRLSNGQRLIARGHCNACNYEAENDPSALIRLDDGDDPRVIWRLDFDDKLTAIYRADHIDGCALFNNLEFCPDGTF